MPHYGARCASCGSHVFFGELTGRSERTSFLFDASEEGHYYSVGTRVKPGDWLKVDLMRDRRVDVPIEAPEAFYRAHAEVCETTRRREKRHRDRAAQA
ncbi:MAG: hypothetical protein KGL39_37175 [Patescibacteria group bacterium]|nr:hypothetical protein [Patescibacteria group bacterium]